jgi:hypothetical protein
MRSNRFFSLNYRLFLNRIPFPKFLSTSFWVFFFFFKFLSASSLIKSQSRNNLKGRIKKKERSIFTGTVVTSTHFSISVLGGLIRNDISSEWLIQFLFVRLFGWRSQPGRCCRNHSDYYWTYVSICSFLVFISNKNKMTHLFLGK